jgi:hypothetical protein
MQDKPEGSLPRDGWPELTYTYVKHYFWEPQHLGLTENSRTGIAARGEKRQQAVENGLRRQEVPLNYLLNVLLRILPASYRRAVLKPFGIDVADPGLGSLTLRTPRNLAYIQPDVQLESRTSRVFIEIKIDAPLGLPQIDKYVRAHADLDELEGLAKKAYVLLLVKRDPLRLEDVDQRIPHADVARELAALVGPGAREVVFGAATWQRFADAMADELERRRGEQSDAVEMLKILTGDFLEELRARGLAQTAPKIP